MIKYIIIFIFFIGCVSENNLRKQNENNDDSIESCSFDRDCTIAIGICDEQRAINENFLEEFNTRNRKLSDLVDCSSFRKNEWLSDPHTKCLSAKCVLISK